MTTMIRTQSHTHALWHSGTQCTLLTCIHYTWMLCKQPINTIHLLYILSTYYISIFRLMFVYLGYWEFLHKFNRLRTFSQHSHTEAHTHTQTHTINKYTRTTYKHKQQRKSDGIIVSSYSYQYFILLRINIMMDDNVLIYWLTYYLLLLLNVLVHTHTE